MPLTMTGADMVASFVISWFAGNIPTIKDAINNESKQKMILESLKPEFEDFNGIQDDYLKTVSYVWHYDRFSANDLLSLMFKVYSIIKNNKGQ